MKRLIQKACREQMTAWFRFFVPPLPVLVTMVFVAITISGCFRGCSAECVRDPWEPWRCVNWDQDVYGYLTPWDLGSWPGITGPDRALPGDKVNLTFNFYPGNFSCSLLWTPPPGASQFEFLDTQPEPGGPPFEFPASDAYPYTSVRYTAPPPPYEGEIIDTLKATCVDVWEKEHFFISIHKTRVYVYTSTLVAEAPPPVSQSPHAQQNVEIWNVRHTLTPQGISLTTELCQDWLPQMTGDKFFIAARMPMTLTSGSTYKVPFVFDTPGAQTVRLRQLLSQTTYFTATIFTATLDYRAERHTFLANTLPSAEGEQWVALGISSVEPITCPQGLNVSAGNWWFSTQFSLDLHDQLQNCQGCTMQLYGCYEGQEEPPNWLGLSSLSQTLGPESYQGEGITCLGPQPIHLGTGGLHLTGPPMSVITPTRPITLHESLTSWAGFAVTVTLDYTSSVDGWQFYGGDETGPDRGTPITATTEIVAPDADYAHIWIINDYVPADTPDGPHSLIITVTNDWLDPLTTWDSIPLWSGEWVAPPLPSGYDAYVYLPLVVKSP